MKKTIFILLSKKSWLKCSLLAQNIFRTLSKFAWGQQYLSAIARGGAPFWRVRGAVSLTYAYAHLWFAPF